MSFGVGDIRLIQTCQKFCDMSYIILRNGYAIICIYGHKIV